MHKLKLHGFNNLTKSLSFCIYDICYAKTADDRDGYIASVAILVGVITFEGWLQRSRTKTVASAVAIPRRMPSEIGLRWLFCETRMVMAVTS